MILLSEWCSASVNRMRASELLFLKWAADVSHVKCFLFLSGVLAAFSPTGLLVHVCSVTSHASPGAPQLCLHVLFESFSFNWSHFFHHWSSACSLTCFAVSFVCLFCSLSSSPFPCCVCMPSPPLLLLRLLFMHGTCCEELEPPSCHSSRLQFHHNVTLNCFYFTCMLAHTRTHTHTPGKALKQ